MNLCKNEGFLTYILCIPIPEYGQSNAPIERSLSGVNFAARPSALTQKKKADERILSFAAAANNLKQTE